MIYFFENAEKCITILIKPSVGMINYDAENATQTPTKVNEWEAILITGEEYRVIWLNAEYDLVFDVTTNGVSESEFWKIVYRLAE